MTNKYTHDKEGRELSLAVPHSNIDYTKSKNIPSQEDIACELQLTALGIFEPLNFKLDPHLWIEDQANFKDYWRPFQPKKNTLNDRESILLYGFENDLPTTPTGLSQYQSVLGYRPNEGELRYPTEAGKQIKTLREVFEYFENFGRTYALRLNAGGFFPPHRDPIHIGRDTIRLIAFLGPECLTGLEWEVDGHRKHFQTNTVYYVDTRKMHRLSAWAHKCDMIVINVPKTWENVLKIMSRLRDQ